MHWFILIISSLATYRFSFMISKEIGPCRIFERIRSLPVEGGCWSKGLSCIMCQTVWWSFLISCWLTFRGSVPWDIFPIYWLSMSSIALIVNEFGPKIE